MDSSVYSNCNSVHLNIANMYAFSCDVVTEQFESASMILLQPRAHLTSDS